MSRSKPSRFAFTFVAFVTALCWSLRAQAQIGTGELLARASFLLLVPLGLVQTLIADRMRSRLPRSQVGLTALIALLAVGAGLLVAVSDTNAHAIGATTAVLALLPGLPVAIGLVRQKSWGTVVIVVVLPALACALIIVDGAWR